MSNSYVLNDRQHATVLAALRYYQIQNIRDPYSISWDLRQIADNCGQVVPLDDKEIDELCERLNATPSPIRQLTRDDMDADGWVTGVVEVDVSRLIETDLDGAMDILSVELTGSELLSDFSYEVVGNKGDVLLIEVTGDASLIWEDEDEN